MLRYTLSSPPRRPVCGHSVRWASNRPYHRGFIERLGQTDPEPSFERYRGLRRWLYACFIGGNILVTSLWVSVGKELLEAKKRAELESGALHDPEGFQDAVHSGIINAPLAEWMMDHASLSRDNIRAGRRYTLLTHSISSGLVASHLIPFFVFFPRRLPGRDAPRLDPGNLRRFGRPRWARLAAAAATVSPRMRFFVGFSPVGIQLPHMAALLLLVPGALSLKNQIEEHNAKALAAHLEAVGKRADEIRASRALDAVSRVEGEAAGTAETLREIGAPRVEEGWQDCAGLTHKHGDEAQKTGMGNENKLAVVRNGPVLRLAQQSQYAYLASAAFGICIGIFWRRGPF
ncbi:hypothetical protein DL766_008687 [Monosporascus sp. MC13-8B]|uniref:Uncharacterized protein n=1 Tax=Monosporascus cannonballus TaxID=155416 RepID=A0ABY0H6N0_9PEZI|nr:hypothetical protein DL762_004816 [Monosporascus cannonballus]RYO93680.1 hypothetical protein DL763_004300 [Monosporascus cannonballus]RYP18385.1 hypothetical protein DL766_008687 [Monosporascus sp. MC13-8B]